MASPPPDPAPRATIGLIAVGSVAAVTGGFGIAFRASGIGYLPQSGLLTVGGLLALLAGVFLARADRRALFARPPRTVATVLAGQHFSAAPVSFGHHHPAAPTRIRVEAWTVVESALTAPSVPAATPAATSPASPTARGATPAPPSGSHRRGGQGRLMPCPPLPPTTTRNPRPSRS